MANYIAWYLVEIESLLREKVREDRLHQCVQEIEDHLLQSAEELEASGMTRSAAELAAIERFGKPESVVATELGPTVEVRRRGVWLGVASLVLAALVSGTTLQVWTEFHTLVMVQPIIWLFLATFLVGCWMCRRILTGPILFIGAAALCVTAFIAAARFTTDNVERADAPYVVAEMRKDAARNWNQANYLEEGTSWFRGISSVNIPNKFLKDGRYVYPITVKTALSTLAHPITGKPIGSALASTATVEYGQTSDWAVATKAWAGLGPILKQEVQWRAQGDTAIANAIERASKDQLLVAFLKRLATNAPVAAGILVLLIAANWLIVRATELRARRSWLRRKLA